MIGSSNVAAILADIREEYEQNQLDHDQVATERGFVEWMAYRIHTAHDALTRITEADDDCFTNLESTVEYVVRLCRQLIVAEQDAADEVERLRTSGGVEVTDALIERLAARAEQSYDLDSPRPPRPSRRRGRPSMGSEAAVAFQVRLEPELYEALGRAAAREDVSLSEMARRALRAYFDDATSNAAGALMMFGREPAEEIE